MTSPRPRPRAVSVVEIPLPAESASPNRRAKSGPASLNTNFADNSAKTVCGRPFWTSPTRSPNLAPLRSTVIAGFAFLAIIFVARFATGEIDLTNLVPGSEPQDARPVIVVQDGRLTNTGNAAAHNLEVTKPRYRLIGTLSPNENLDLPANDFTVSFEWNENGKTERATRSFKTGPEEPAANGRVVGTTQASDAQSGASVNAIAPQGITATYDPATHLLTVSAEKSVEVHVDGFLLRPIARTDKEGAQYRYVQANVLVLGQDIQQGETVAFEVVFTKPQDFYSIPIYIREPGKPAAYFTVSVSTRGESAS